MLRGNRFRLLTLGRLTLVGEAGEEDASLARRRFKLALLAVLAMARRPLSRDVLLEMFWGEQDEARARHSLSNALSSLRRALGQRGITTRDADVALAPDLPLDVDALELAEAVENRDFARAIELYGGPFLEGMHVDDSPAFEQWSSRERRRLEALFVHACTQQCAMLARTRQWTECGAVAARWLDAEPLSGDAAIYLLNATKAPGTRAALAQALDEYERIRVRLARDFELAPEKSVNELVERIREQLAAAAPDPVPGERVTPRTSADAAPQPAPEVTRSEPETGGVLVSPAGAAVPSTAPTRTLSRPPSRTLRSALAAAIVLGALLLPVVLWRFGLPSLDSATRGRKPVIAVLGMSLRTNDSSLTWLAEGLPQMIAGSLAHVTAVDVV
ncbi:MAG TPA: BTAD domain-containing putative transcriptional regulator, partial [Gemmatimonadaceae bacterium]|nr:BTAD domain-containing putative transcriptional regulator [Gemmatimonadaceae bacterium]